MHQIAIVLSFGMGITVFNAAALAKENDEPKKQRLRVVLDADGNVEITPTSAGPQELKKKVVITCESVRIKRPKKGDSTFEMTFIGAVRLVARNNRMRSKRMTLSMPDGVRLFLNFKESLEPLKSGLKR